MFNQIRAEFYKLFHTKALYLTFALILAVFGIFSIGGQQQFVASSSSLDETWKIGETVGFLARAYSDTAHPCLLYTSIPCAGVPRPALSKIARITSARISLLIKIAISARS